MKRKHQESIIKLAFSEYKNETEKKVLEACQIDKECQKELEMLSSIRDGLKQTRQSTPECQMSVERVRDAILNQNIQEPRSSTTFWSWASVAVAACAFVFVLNANRQKSIEPRVVASAERPSIIQQNNALAETAPEARTAFLVPEDFITDPEVKTTTAQRRISMPVRTVGAQTDIMATMTARTIEHALSNRGDSNRNMRKSSLVGAAPMEDKSVGAPVDAEPIIMIDTNTDNDTGAQVATEVESVENVHIGG